MSPTKLTTLLILALIATAGARALVNAERAPVDPEVQISEVISWPVGPSRKRAPDDTDEDESSNAAQHQARDSSLSDFSVLPPLYASSRIVDLSTGCQDPPSPISHRDVHTIDVQLRIRLRHLTSTALRMTRRQQRCSVAGVMPPRPSRGSTGSPCRVYQCVRPLLLSPPSRSYTSSWNRCAPPPGRQNAPSNLMTGQLIVTRLVRDSTRPPHLPTSPPELRRRTSRLTCEEPEWNTTLAQMSAPLALCCPSHFRNLSRLWVRSPRASFIPAAPQISPVSRGVPPPLPPPRQSQATTQGHRSHVPAYLRVPPHYRILAFSCADAGAPTEGDTALARHSQHARHHCGAQISASVQAR
ncbi:hypothetical protein C8J57DRAFT_1628682 [Mycena rebaudengoi]|nr:hypothetical protein C8J57DRAFT_1628682 [Mycena rebaudengoi]